jgi:hypothetical protein
MFVNLCAFLYSRNVSPMESYQVSLLVSMVYLDCLAVVFTEKVKVMLEVLMDRPLQD